MNRRDFGKSGLAGLAAFAWPGAAAAQADGSPSYRYIHLDVFTDRRLQGNQLFVFVQPAGLDADTLQRPLQILAHRRIVFGQEDSCHEPSMLRQNAFFQKRIMRSCVAGSLSKS
jgi:hypothetical protein